eukprot:1006491_1
MAIPKLIKKTVTKVNRIQSLKIKPIIYAPTINKTVLPSRFGLNHLETLQPINMHHTKQFLESPTLLHKMIYNMNYYGICLINLRNFDNTTFGHREFLKDNLFYLKPLFGNTAFHQKSDTQTGILTIDPRTPNSVNVANTHIDHPVHTDGAFQKYPEKIVCIGAEHVAREPNGGLTTLICGQNMLKWVLNKLDINDFDKR